MDIHYFDDIANANLKKPKYWGLFSLEGGRKENMNNIINKIKQMIEYLQDADFKSDPDAYGDFIKQYNLVKSKRDQLQDYADSLWRICTPYLQQLKDRKRFIFRAVISETHWESLQIPP